MVGRLKSGVLLSAKTLEMPRLEDREVQSPKVAVFWSIQFTLQREEKSSELVVMGL